LEDALQKIDRHKTESSLHLAFMADANFMDNLCVYTVHSARSSTRLTRSCTM
jgi:hypothetical protein